MHDHLHSPNRNLAPSSFSSPRWHWTSVASAATGAAAASPLSAEVVEINLQNQIYSVQNGVESTAPLNPDITGDGNDDFSTFYGVPLSADNVASTQNTSLFYNKRGAALRIDSRPLSVQIYVNFFYTTEFSNAAGNFFRARVNSLSDNDPLPLALSGFIPVLFTDQDINSGRQTGGFLQIQVLSTSAIDHFIEIQKLIFDNASRQFPVVDDIDYPDFVRGAVPPSTDVDRTMLLERMTVERQIRKIKKKIKRARKSGRKSQLKRFRKLEKRLRNRLRQLE